MIKYSVIIPIYNSEKTLKRCLESLVSQNREDIQIIAVNDGSSDSSEIIIKEFASKYSAIEYVSIENAGVSQARNVGLKKAKGTYITFVDSDDYVREDYFSVLDQAENADLFVFAHENVGGAPLEESALFSKLKQMDSFEDRMELLLASRKIMSPWNKRFKAVLIKDFALQFIANMHTGEDFNFCMAYAVHCKTMELSSEKILYVDISNQDSLSRKYRPMLDSKLKNVYMHIWNTLQNSELSVQLKERLLTVADYLFVKHVFSCISEEFKQTKLHYFRDHKRIIQICNVFQQPLSPKRCNVIHWALRLALRWKIRYPFYLLSYLVKGRKYIK